MAIRKDPAPLKRAVDPVTKRVLTPEPSYPAGRGTIRKSHEDIAPMVEREQKRQSNDSDPSRK
jgi:hypothetical protein